MIMHSIFDPATGVFSGVKIGGSSLRIIEMNIPEGMAAIEGVYDHISQRVDVAVIVGDQQEDFKADDFAGMPRINNFPQIPGGLKVPRLRKLFTPSNAPVIDYQPPQTDPDTEWRIDPQINLPRWLKKPEVVAIENSKAKAMARITELESDHQPRAMREAVIALLGRDNQAASRLVAIDDEIVAQRVTLQVTSVTPMAAEIAKP